MNRLENNCIQQLCQRSVGILGAGITGESVKRFLAPKAAELFVIVDRAESADEISTEVFLKSPPSIDLLVVSPGFKPAHPMLQWALQTKVPILSDIAIFLAYTVKPIIAITGTNGKSTVATLAYELLKAQYEKVVLGGNIGIPVLDLTDFEIVVLELSSFQLWFTPNIRSDSCVILNIQPDHLDWHASYKEYVSAKWRIVENAKHVVVNAGLSKDCPVAHEVFSLEEITHALEGVNLSPALTSIHQQLNVCAVLKLLIPFEITDQVVYKVLSDFQGLSYRTECYIGTRGEVWVNDSKGTNVAAARAALCSFKKDFNGKIVLILGGVGKNQDFKPLLKDAFECVEEIIAYGEVAVSLSKERASIKVVTLLKEAVQLAYTLVKPSGCVLFSPACASFDQFKDYMARGYAFDGYVQEMEELSAGASLRMMDEN